MKFVKTGEYRPDALEHSVEINPLEEAQKRLKRMNYLIGFIREKNPEVLQEYVKNLLVKYQNLSNVEQVKSNPFDLDELVSDNPHMKEHLELARVALNYYLQVLQLPDDFNLEKSKVVNKNYLQSFLHPAYYNLLVLTETLDRTDAIALYKKFVTHYIIDRRDPDRDTYDNLETLFTKSIEPKEEPSEWVVVRGMIDDGKYAYRNDNCLWINAIEDLPDSELKYYVCCYGDYEMAKNLHDSVILTMEHTIAQGNPYCSRVLHDTRVDWDMTHPPTDFWDNIGDFE
ncbi:MAG: L-2-amino-thiazoline-4-carboxylic acid hydrolase [Candidatus Thorarchaeota archaeon]|nr:L-2-amino-thiazoline-4-carboxylic acid hydrolase [Candidatus Thorarchaeota archaeon]